MCVCQRQRQCLSHQCVFLCSRCVRKGSLFFIFYIYYGFKSVCGMYICKCIHVHTHNKSYGTCQLLHVRSHKVAHSIRRVRGCVLGVCGKEQAATSDQWRASQGGPGLSV